MKKLLYILSIGACLWTINACDTEDDLIQDQLNNNPLSEPIEGVAGTLNLSKYVAIGNSLTAGFMDGALYNVGQANAFPVLLHNKLATVPGAGQEFNQPDINSANGFNSAVSNIGAGVILGRAVLDLSAKAPVFLPGELPTAFGGNKAALNNFGVPGIQTGQLLTPLTGTPGSPIENPLYTRFASSPGTSTILGDALAASPTFVTLWIGGNDVLGYAISGASNEAIFTSVDAFTAQFGTVITQIMTNSQASGVVMNLPPVTLLPFFRAVKYNPVPLDAANAAALNAGFAGFNAAIDGLVANSLLSSADGQKRKVAYAAASNNPLLIVDEDLEDLGPKFDILQGAGAITAEERAQLQPFVKSRPAVATDLVLLSAAPQIGVVLGGNPTLLNGISVPFEDKFILTLAEQGKLIERTAIFNGVIAATLTGNTRLKMLDVNPLFADLFGLTPTTAAQLALSSAAQAAADGVLGLSIEGVTLQPDFSPNGVFSTDGIHPNPRGNAILVNEIIALLRENFGTELIPYSIFEVEGTSIQP